MKIGENQVGLSWVGKHVVLFELKISEKGVATDSVYDLE